jgi:hypothetical protein
MYKVHGVGTHSPLGNLTITGTVTLHPTSSEATGAQEEISAKVYLNKVYEPGTVKSAGAIQSLPTQGMVVHKASRNVVDALLQHGCDVNSGDPSGNTALMISAKEHGDDISVVALLARRGAGINEVNNAGHTALVLANESGALSMVNFLLRNGALTTLKRGTE